MHSWKGARGTANLSAVWIIRPPTHTPAQKCFITHVRARIHTRVRPVYIDLPCPFERDTRARRCALFARKNKREFRFWCALAQKYFIMSTETNGFNVSRYIPFARIELVARRWSLLRILVLQSKPFRGPVKGCIYLPYGRDSRQTFYTKTMRKRDPRDG